MEELSPAQCYRAATVDGNNTIFLIPEYEEQRLGANVRLVNNRRLLSLVSRVLDWAELKLKVFVLFYGICRSFYLVYHKRKFTIIHLWVNPSR